MAVTDDQLELLEAYLDGELPADQEAAFNVRLASESELASALQTLQAECDVRSLVWKACEPDENTVRRLVMKVKAQVDREAIWAHRYAKWRIPSAAAACILIGFFVGWLIRGTPSSPAMDPGSMAVNNTLSGPLLPNNSVAPGIVNVAAKNFDLPLVDEYGRGMGAQHFKSAADMQSYLDEITNWQHSQEKVQSGGNVTLTGAQKF